MAEWNPGRTRSIPQRGNSKPRAPCAAGTHMLNELDSLCVIATRRGSQCFQKTSGTVKSAFLGRCVPFVAFCGPCGTFVHPVTLASVIGVPRHGCRADQDEADQQCPTSHRHVRHVSIHPWYQRAGREMMAGAAPSGLGHPSANPEHIAAVRGDNTSAAHRERKLAWRGAMETHATRSAASDNQQPQLRMKRPLQRR